MSSDVDIACRKDASITLSFHSGGPEWRLDLIAEPGQQMDGAFVQLTEDQATTLAQTILDYLDPYRKCAPACKADCHCCCGGCRCACHEGEL